MVEIGINKGWKLQDIVVNDKSTIEVHFGKGEMASSLMDLIASEIEEETSKLLMFTPSMEYKDKARNPKDIAKDIRRMYRIFFKIFNLYNTKEEILKVYPLEAVYTGIKITRENEKTLLLNEAVVTKIWSNIGKLAKNALVKLKITDRPEGLRIKFIRQSKNKPYPAFPFKIDGDNWVELDTVSDALSKVKFSSWEESKGYDSAMPVDAIPEATNDVFEAGEDAIPEAGEAGPVSTEELPFM